MEIHEHDGFTYLSDDINKNHDWLVIKGVGVILTGASVLAMTHELTFFKDVQGTGC